MPTTPPGAKTLLTRYSIPDGEAQSELVIKNSVFVGNVACAPTREAAQRFVSAIGKKYGDANHNAWAFKIRGDPQALIGSSDDGEPGGTAGRPMLAVLEGSGLCQVVAVVSRFWGGRKLGTGGLVRAYGGAVRQCLKALPTKELVRHRVARVTVDYGVYGALKYQLPKLGVFLEDEVFAAAATFAVIVPYHQLDDVAAMMRDLSGGRVMLEERWSDVCYRTPRPAI